MPSARGRVTLALLAAGLALAAGCGGDEGGPVDGSSYSFTAPEGWTPITADEYNELAGDQPFSSTYEIDAAAANEETGENVGVAIQSDPPFPREVTRHSARKVQRIYTNPEITSAILGDTRIGGVPDVKPTMVDGTKMLSVSFSASSEDDELEVRQLIGPHDGTGYTVALIAQDDQTAARAFDQVVESWSWN